MATASRIDPGLSLGALVSERPARAELFERLRLEYCCGGRQTLAQACAKRGLDPARVMAALSELDGERVDSTGIESTDWREASTAELCAHIVTVHHDGLREAFPRLNRLLATVAQVHGETQEPRLRDTQRLFGEIWNELEPHLASEEDELFPACVAWERDGTPVDERLVIEHEQEHTALGHALAALRIQCDDYDRATALCTTHRALLDALEAFEQDLHRHVHEENNILLPRLRETPPRQRLASRSPAVIDDPEDLEPAQSLPTCCESWIAEQTHSWAVHHRAR